MKMQKLKATTQKDYYGKAKMFIDDDGATVLQSYNTSVAKITKNGVFVRLWAGHSSTTQKHINDFRKLHGFNTINKKQWMALPCENEKAVYSVTISNGFCSHTGTARLTYSEAQAQAEKIQQARKNIFVWID